MCRMTTVFAKEPGAGLPDDELPAYTHMLHAYHRAHACDLRAILAAIPLALHDRVLDLACGDGCYTIWLAERGAQVIGADLSPACLDLARQRADATPYAAKIHFEQVDAAALPFKDGEFDLGWCSQSLYSLPDPLAALHELARVIRTEGHIAILENDALHQIVLPWPADLELAVRQAQFKALAAEYGEQMVKKFYIGRDLCGLLQQVGIKPCVVRAFPVERRAPLVGDEQLFLKLYFADLRQRAWPYLSTAMRQAFDMLLDPCSETYLLRQHDFYLIYLELLVIGAKERAPC